MGVRQWWRLADRVAADRAVVGGLVAALIAAFAPILVLAHEFGLSNFATPFVIEVPCAAVGLLVARRQSDNPIGWLLLVGCCAGVLSSDAGYYAWAVYGRGNDALPLGWLAVLLGQTGDGAVIALPLVILLFPDGRTPSQRWRWAVIAYVALGRSRWRAWSRFRPAR